jgi:hypothetical protein
MKKKNQNRTNVTIKKTTSHYDHACNPSYVGGWIRSITFSSKMDWRCGSSGQAAALQGRSPAPEEEEETGRAQRLTPVLPATREADESED